MYELLYYNYTGKPDVNYVGVSLRKWTGPRLVDIVLQYVLIVDGNRIMDKRECFGPESGYIKKYIDVADKKFAELVDFHPTLERGEF